MERQKIVTIKDFNAGDKVYTLELHTGQCLEGKPIPPDIQKVEVVSVGKKYLQTSREKYQNDDREYLKEVVTYGRAKMLFGTEKEVKNYLEKMELAKWLGTMSTTDVEAYSLEQLRKVKEILDEADQE